MVSRQTWFLFEVNGNTTLWLKITDYKLSTYNNEVSLRPPVYFALLKTQYFFSFNFAVSPYKAFLDLPCAE